MIFRALIIAAAALVAPTAALAQPIELKSEIFVERLQAQTDGSEATVLVPADRVVPGDRLRFVISYANPSDQQASNFIITNPIPASIAYLGADGPATVTVSVDGKTYGDLAELVVREADGSERPAQTSDVTHVQWAFAAIEPQSSGQVLYRGELK